jgi:hypothetical protein
LKNIFLIIITLLFSNLTKAQPGWIDFTPRYSYTILDENSNEISFQNNKNYSIMIDDVLYKTPNVPQDSLKPAIENSGIFEPQIRINDFSLIIHKKDFEQTQKSLEIKIIHKKDTMFICQTSGTGSFFSKYDFDNRQYETQRQTSDFTLQFVAGHYFFPRWSKDFLKNLPQTNGTVKILNADQRHFIVPKIVYDSICYLSPIYDNRQKHYDEAESLVVQNFMSGYYSFEKNVQQVTFDKPIFPFKIGYMTWRAPYFSTKEKNEYLGIVQPYYDTLNYSGGRGMIVKFNYDENKMKIWSATENLLYSSSYNLRHDTFNNVFYNQTLIRDSNCKDLIYKCDFEIKLYQSKDDGNTWAENNKLTQLYKKHEFRELEFLDQHHALIFKLNKVKPQNKKYDIQQGVYYLLKDFVIIDSLKTPNDIHYNDNYNRYRYDVENDTIFLGNWSYDKYYTNGKTEYSQPILTKNNKKWKFQVVEKMYFINHSKPLLETIYYRNFEILNSTIYLNKHNGGLVFQNDNLSELHKKGLILENNNEVYLIGLSIGTLFSFDGGYNWYVYPLPLEKDSDYKLIEINNKGVISHIKNNSNNGKYTLDKIFNKFTKLNE